MRIQTGHNKGFSVIVIGIILLFISIFTASAQSTPTDSPVEPRLTSETPSTPSAETAPETTQGQPFEPFTQSDLTIVTGDVQRPNGIVWYNNNLYTACTGDSTLYEINSVSGETLTYIGGVQNAHTLYAEPNENFALDLWVPDFSSNQLLHITRQGITRVNSDLAGPWGIAAYDDERFLITNLFGNSLVVVTRDGEAETLLTDLSSPTGLVMDGDMFYVANNGSTRRAIEYYDAGIVEGTAQSENNVLVSGMQNTTGLVMGGDGNLYFAFALGTRGVVGRVDPAECREKGGCTAEDVEIVIYTELEAPLAGLTISDDMRLFVHTMFRPEIYWVQIDN